MHFTGKTTILALSASLLACTLAAPMPGKGNTGGGTAAVAQTQNTAAAAGAGGAGGNGGHPPHGSGGPTGPPSSPSSDSGETASSGSSEDLIQVKPGSMNKPTQQFGMFKYNKDGEVEGMEQTSSDPRHAEQLARAPKYGTKPGSTMRYYKVGDKNMSGNPDGKVTDAAEFYSDVSQGKGAVGAAMLAVSAGAGTKAYANILPKGPITKHHVAANLLASATGIVGTAGTPGSPGTLAPETPASGTAGSPGTAGGTPAQSSRSKASAGSKRPNPDASQGGPDKKPKSGGNGNGNGGKGGKGGSGTAV